MLSSSDDEIEQTKRASDNREKFVMILQKYRIVLMKCMVPKVISAKEDAWKQIREEFFNETGKAVNIEQLKKLLNNMKSTVKKKTYLSMTGNKPVRLLGWEKNFLELLCAEEYPVFNKMTIATSLEANTTDRSQIKNEEAESSTSSNAIRSPSEKRRNSQSKLSNDIAQCSVRSSGGGPSSKKQKILTSETAETLNLSTDELQRLLLLEQLRLTRLQIQKEELQLDRLHE